MELHFSYPHSQTMCMNERSGADSWACWIISLISRTTASFSAMCSSLKARALLLLSFTDANPAIPGVGSSNPPLAGNGFAQARLPRAPSSPLGHFEEDWTLRAVLGKLSEPETAAATTRDWAVLFFWHDAVRLVRGPGHHTSTTSDRTELAEGLLRPGGNGDRDRPRACGRDRYPVN
jgi:hypothetical protein